MPRPKFGIIASLMEQTEKKLIHALLELEGFGKVQTQEIRLDPFFGTVELSKVLDGLAEVLLRPTILTLRSKEQGGSEIIPLKDQWDFWNNLPQDLHVAVVDLKSDVYVDFGLDLLDWAKENKKSLPFPAGKIGVSFHDFSGQLSREELLVLYEKMILTKKADAFVKIVSMAKSKDDFSKLRTLLQAHSGHTIPLMTFLMGPHGEESRRKCMLEGSDGTYGYLPGRQKAAPGQLSVEELSEDPDVNEALEGIKV